MRAKKTHPLTWVPSTYFAMGSVYKTVTDATNIMFQNLGLSNATAAFWASAFGLPYTIKFLWAPLLEMYKTKKFFVVAMQVAIAVGLVLMGLALSLPDWLTATIVLCYVLGVLGATQDIAADGVYVTGLNATEQARYTGFQSMFWNVGPLFVTGILLSATGVFHNQLGMDWVGSWRTAFLILGGVLIASAVLHSRVMPPGAKADDAPRNVGEAAATFMDSFRSFFQKKGIWTMIGFAFLYRTSQGFLDKVGPLFLKDELVDGGLEMSNEVLGFINGTVGLLGFLAGSVLGGLWIARKGLKPTLIWLCAAVNIPNATYIYLGVVQPQDVWVIGSIVTFEKFFFGFGAVGHMLYMMQQLAPGRYQTAHYAFGTALMGLCMMVTGMVSGWMQEQMGYVNFFIFVMVATIPSFIVTYIAPFHVDTSQEEPAKT